MTVYSYPTYVTAHAHAEKLGAGVSRKYLFDRQIVLYHSAEARRDAIDTWLGAVLEDAAHWNPKNPYLVLHDISGMYTSAYARHAVEKLARFYPADMHGRYAMLVERGAFGRLVQVLGARQIHKLLPQFESGFFYDAGLALDWLLEMLTTHHH